MQLRVVRLIDSWLTLQEPVELARSPRHLAETHSLRNRPTRDIEAQHADETLAEKDKAIAQILTECSHTLQEQLIGLSRLKQKDFYRKPLHDV